MRLLPILIALPLHAASTPQSTTSPQWQLALPGYSFSFPDDHHAHPNFKTEWWYATGNLRSASGQPFGFQFTIFRQGIRPPNSLPKSSSRFVLDHFYFAHFALSDISDKKFLYAQIASRGAFDEAGHSLPGDTKSPLAWLPGASIRLLPDSSFEISADALSSDGTPFSLRLTLDPQGHPPIIQGQNGVSQKSAGEGHASHYYSFPDLTAHGSLTLGDTEPIPVTGKSWLDREWSTSMLAKNQVGWDWFALRLDDGRQLMLYQLRQKDGSPDPASSGSLISKNRTARHLDSSTFTLTPLTTWKSPHSGATYPTSWQIKIPSEKIDITATSTLDDQELALPVVQYYEGAIRATGSHPGEGYMELTGYAGPLSALTR